MSDQTPTDAVPEGSELHDALVQSGAHAQAVDVDAMLAQMQAMQAQYEQQNKMLADRIKSLEAERGVPSDPVAGAVANLLAHVEARAAQYPNDDFSDIIKEIKALPESGAITVSHTGLIHDMVSEAVDDRPRHELGYVKRLSRDLHRLILKQITTPAASS